MPAEPLPLAAGRGWHAAGAIVFLAGVNLILIQWVLVRELTALLLGTELVVLWVIVTYFAGLSLGFALAGRVSWRGLLAFGVVAFGLHLTLPVWFRLLVTALADADRYGAAFLLPLLVPFLISAFYSMFLPRLVDRGEGSLASLYGVEVLGSACGVLLLVVLGGLGLQPLFAVYGVLLLVILALLRLPAFALAAAFVGLAAWLAVLPAAADWSNARSFEAVQGMPEGTRTAYSAYTPYQKIDVMEAPDGTQYLYLDGLRHFGSYSGQRLNVVMGHVPAVLLRPEQALVVGAGSMEMERMIAEHAGHVATVELDPVVAATSIRFFTEFNWMDRLTNRSIIFDDAKHFIATTDQRYDLVAMDVPAAYAIQTATLYSVPFYSEVERHLNPGGILVAGLTSNLTGRTDTPRRVAASLLAVFDEVVVVTPASVGWSFAYAADALPFDVRQLEAALTDSGEDEYVIYETAAVRALVGDARPITLDSMDVALHVSADWIRERLER